DKFFVIESGLNDGDKVAMNPRAYVAEVTLPKLAPEEAQRAVPQPSRVQQGERTAARDGGEKQAGGEAPAAQVDSTTAAVVEPSSGS
ncbi:hypothetical protein MRO55_25475, partial [Escherichia coli]|uniref:hypothetical protein n=1 Tax=Escherichia coli TaxID=562 RepID=UPI002113A7F3